MLKEGRVRFFWGLSRGARVAPSVAREGASQYKLDSRLHWAAVRSIFLCAESG